MNRWLLLLLPLLLSACASKPLVVASPEHLFHDARFNAPSEPVRSDDLFTLSPEMKRFVRQDYQRNASPERALFDALQAGGQLKLDYDSTQTRNAADTFAMRSGNCLSLVLMTAAFAKEMGIEVRYQTVLGENTWSRSGDLQFSSGHVNLSLAKRLLESPLSTLNLSQAMTIDFLPPDLIAGNRVAEISESAIVSMYLNNRAAEALASGRLDDAYWWARSAIRADPALILAYNTLGVVYQRHGELDLAELVFAHALAREPDNTVLMPNMVRLLAQLGKTEQSEQLAARLARIDPYPVFHFFNLGMNAMRAADYASAQRHFAKEVERAPYYHEFHFWLAMSSYHLGELKKAGRQLALALENSTTRSDRTLYGAKLDRLRMEQRDRQASIH